MRMNNFLFLTIVTTTLLIVFIPRSTPFDIFGGVPFFGNSTIPSGFLPSPAPPPPPGGAPAAAPQLPVVVETPPRDGKVLDKNGNPVKQGRYYKIMTYGSTIEGVGLEKAFMSCPFYVVLKRPNATEPLKGPLPLQFHIRRPQATAILDTTNKDKDTVYEGESIGIEFKIKFVFLQQCDDTMVWDMRETTLRTGGRFPNTRFRIVYVGDRVYRLQICTLNVDAVAGVSACQDIGARANPNVFNYSSLVVRNSNEASFHFQIQAV